MANLVEKKIDSFIEEMRERGCHVDPLTYEYLTHHVIQIIASSKDQSLEEILLPIVKQIEYNISDFLKKTGELSETDPTKVSIASGLSLAIGISSLDPKKTYTLQFYQGKISRDEESSIIDEDTVFDTASNGKFFLNLLFYKAELEKGINRFDRIAELSNRFPGLEDFTAENLRHLCGTLETKGDIEISPTMEEAIKRLESVYLTSKDCTRNEYTDLGALVLGEVLADLYETSYADLLHKLVLDPYQLSHTVFYPGYLGYEVAGNGRRDKQIHDSKTRRLGGESAAAGPFSNVTDYVKLFNEFHLNSHGIYEPGHDLIQGHQLEDLGEVTFKRSKHSSKGHFIYVRKDTGFLGLEDTYVPNIFTPNSFGSQGWTGAVIACDAKQGIHYSILPSAIPYGQNQKPIGFKPAFKKLQQNITLASMVLYLVHQYYEKQQDQAVQYIMKR